MSPNEITIYNILQHQPIELAQWLSEHVLNVRIPQPGPNHTLDIQTDLMPIIAQIANSIAMVTELYNLCVGAKAPWTANKKNPDKKADAETNITIMGAHVDILYRTLQSLEAMRESASRLMTGVGHVNRLST